MTSNGAVSATPNASSYPTSNQHHTSLFVGNLDGRVYRELLTEIFSIVGRVTQCHVVYDKNTGQSSGFGFVHYEDHATAEAAMDKFRGRKIYGKLMTIDWARANNNSSNDRHQSTNNANSNNNTNNNPNSQNQQSQGNTQVENGNTSGNFCLFVGNLSSTVTDEQLVNAFSVFGSCISAKCAKDPVTYETQGYAFVTFRNREDAVSAMQAMNGQLLNNRPLRVDWAKGKTGGGNGGAGGNDSQNKTDKDKEIMTYEAVLNQTSVNNITAYISGLPQGTTEDAIRDTFARFGMIRDIRIPDSAKSSTSETMYAFVRYIDHATAAKAIFQCQNGATQVGNKTVNVHWGREVMRRPQYHNMQMQQRAYLQMQQPQPNNFHQNPNLNYYQHQQQQQHPQQQYQQFHQQAAANPYSFQQQQQALHQQPPQQQPPQQFQQTQQQVQSARSMYHSQPYGRSGPGPMHQPAATAQHRYRPY